VYPTILLSPSNRSILIPPIPTFFTSFARCLLYLEQMVDGFDRSTPAPTEWGFLVPEAVEILI
jgi:hypothetical protein